MDASTRFWDRTAARYAAQPIGNPEHYQRKLELTRRYLTPESRVLEFGCGTGSTALEHAPYVASLLGVDTSSAMVDIARGKLAANALSNVSFRVGGLDDVDGHDGLFDVVLGLNVLHLVPDWEAAIRRCHALLNPGGVLVTSTVLFGDGFSIWKLLLPPAALTGRIPKVVFIKRAAFEQAHLEAGFELVDVLEPPRLPGGLFLVARKVR